MIEIINHVWAKIASQKIKKEQFGPEHPSICSLLYKTKDKTVLDFGSGLGRNKEYLENNFKSVDYCDIPEMRKHFPCKTFQEIQNNKYDVIYSAFTFQHFLSAQSIKDTATKFLDMTNHVYLITRSYCDGGGNVLQCFLDAGWSVLRYTIPPKVFSQLKDETCAEFLLVKEKLEESDELIYIDYNQLYSDLLTWTKEQEFNYSGIYGVPRSGSIVAGILSQILDLPLIEPRPKSSRKINNKSGPILIIDDTSWTGSSIEYSKNNPLADRICLEDINVSWNGRFEYAAVYCSSYMAARLDKFYKILPTIKHTFSWNFLKDINVSSYTCDLDGVFCRDFEFGQDEGEKYQNFLNNARPNIIPKYPIGKIVTARLGKYRHQTQEWLYRHNIQYGELVMLNCDSHEERSKIDIPKYKAEQYEGLLFVESALDQAIRIKDITGKKVFCTDIMGMI